MKKLIFFTLFFVILSINISAADWTIKTNKLKISLKVLTSNTVYFSSIENRETNTETILPNPGKIQNIWAFDVKKSMEFSSDPITLTGEDAKELSVTENRNTIVLTWKDVKKNNMTKGFDVIVTGKKNGDDINWNINIKSNTKEWAVWNCNFPQITLSFRNGDELFSGLLGGHIETTNVPGHRPSVPGFDFLPWYPYPVGDVPMQMISLTKGGSGIYLCPLDTEGWHKHFKIPSINTEEIEYSIETYPNDQGVGGISYRQAYDFNISAFSGDWFDCVKKYRAWGIKAGNMPFRKGPIKDRKDFPEWAKKNVFWGNDYQKYIAGNVPTAFHLYVWWQLPMDVGYPEMLPANEPVMESWLERFKNGNLNFILYTNPHLIDTKNSPLYQKMGDSVCSLKEDLQPNRFEWGHADTINSSLCPSLDICQDTIADLHRKTISDYHNNSIYVDEINMIEPEPCFNKDHGHTLGTGNRWVKDYNRLFERIKREGSEIQGDPIILFSEGTAEPFDIDGMLDLKANPTTPYGKAAYYSGYRIMYGMNYEPYDFSPSQMPGIAKLAYTLNEGVQLGWYQHLPENTDYPNFPEFTLYQKNACLARNYASDYFTCGEFVRPVKITNEIPYADTEVDPWPHKGGTIYHIPSVQTSSWNLDGKTMICFTNILNEKVSVEWESCAKDLYLKNKKSYKITKSFPETADWTDTEGKIKGKFEINPLETIIVIVE